MVSEAQSSNKSLESGIVWTLGEEGGRGTAAVAGAGCRPRNRGSAGLPPESLGRTLDGTGCSGRRAGGAAWPLFMNCALSASLLALAGAAETVAAGAAVERGAALP